MPTPVQARAHLTIRSAIEVAADLIDELGEDGLRMQDVVDRSGVSAGSLTHHFGSREGLVAAALMERFDRAAQMRARSFDLDRSDPQRFAAGMSAMLASAAAGERDAWRLARIRALSYARHRPELRAALVESIASLEQAMTDRLAVAAPGLHDGWPVSPRALVVYSETYSAGRIVDTVFGDPLPMEEWAALFAHLVRGYVAGPIADAAIGLAPPADRIVAHRPEAPALAPDERPIIPHLDLDANERRILDAAIDLQRSSGADSVRVRDLVATTGLSRSWFARHFGEREEILDHVNLCNLIGFSRRESALIEAAFDQATDGEDLRTRLGGIVRIMSEPDVLAGSWDRLELIASAAARPWLARQAGPIVHATLGRMSAAIAGAQARGLLLPDVPPRAVARFLWAAPLAFVLGDLVGVEWDELSRLAGRTTWTLVATGA
jgi:AcrR family transcriptional regulator